MCSARAPNPNLFHTRKCVRYCVCGGNAWRFQRESVKAASHAPTDSLVCKLTSHGGDQIFLCRKTGPLLHQNSQPLLCFCYALDSVIRILVSIPRGRATGFHSGHVVLGAFDFRAPRTAHIRRECRVRITLLGTQGGGASPGYRCNEMGIPQKPGDSSIWSVCAHYNHLAPVTQSLD